MNIYFKQCNSANFKRGRSKEIKYIVIHYTANDGDTAKGNANYFANNKVGASAHYFVDDKEIYQSVLDTDTAWHCGTKGAYKHPYCRNDNSIGVELCSRKNNAGKYYFKENTVTNAVELVRSLMKKYNVPASNVIRHYDVTGKNCPAPFVENETAWKDFKRLIEEDGEVQSTKVVYKGKTLEGFIKDGKTYAEVRKLCEAFGKKVTWNNAKKVVEVSD